MPVLAQNEGEGEYGETPGHDGSPSGFSGTTTRNVVRVLERGIEQCEPLHSVYRFDCYRKAYRQAANQMRDNPQYADAFTALVSVEKALEQIVEQNKDPSPPTATKRARRLTPIKPAAVRRANADFKKALSLAETALLRSPNRTQTHYARIAQAVHSNKVLLRS